MVGASAAFIAFGGVYVALAATQAGIEEAQETTPRPAVTVTQSGIQAAQETVRADRQKTEPTARPVSDSRRASDRATDTGSAKTKQAGLAEAAAPGHELKKDEEKEKERKQEEDRRDLASIGRSDADAQSPDVGATAPAQQAPAPVQQAPVQQAPVPVQQAPVQQAPAPVQQAPAPAPVTIDLGGRGAVVPQAPIAPKHLHIG